MGRQGKTLKYLLMILLLLVGCVTPVLATVDFQVTPVYQLLAWSPDETEILALSKFPLPDLITKTQLIMMKFNSFSSVIIEETEPHEGRIELPSSFRKYINEMKEKGFKPGKIVVAPREIPEDHYQWTYPKPLLFSSGQTLEIELIDDKYLLVLRQVMEGIAPAEIIISDLTPMLKKECPMLFEDDSEVHSVGIYSNQINLSPTMEKAIVPIEVEYSKMGIDFHHSLLVGFSFAEECSRLHNICGFRLYKVKDYTRAEEQFIHAFVANSRNSQPIYNLACICALTKRYSDALNYLEIAVSLNPNYKKKALEDSDFDSLRETYSFLFNKIVNGR